MANLEDQQPAYAWYVLRALSGKENKVKEYVEAEIKIGHFGKAVSQVMVPTEKVYQQRNGKKVLKERNYLPGYVLVEAALDGETAYKLTSIPNVMGFLMEPGAKADSKPMPIREEEAARLLGQNLAEPGEMSAAAADYSVGDKVKVTDGPFSGFSGVVEEVNLERQKLEVMVAIFGRNTPLELDFVQVEKDVQ